MIQYSRALVAPTSLGNEELLVGYMKRFNSKSLYTSSHGLHRRIILSQPQNLKRQNEIKVIVVSSQICTVLKHHISSKCVLMSFSSQTEALPPIYWLRDQ